VHGRRTIETTTHTNATTYSTTTQRDANRCSNGKTVTIFKEKLSF
jgi:hypothetical protein